jgi:hypothetical protein
MWRSSRSRAGRVGPTMTDFTILARPRIQPATFVRILREAHSPAAAVAQQAWTAIVSHGVDPALALAVFQHESSFGKAGAAVSRRNWGNLRRSPHFKSDGRFVVYPTWIDGAGDAARLLAIYGHNKIRPKTPTSTARTFPFVWAPSADGNRPARYGNAVVASIQHYIDLDRLWHPSPGGHPAAPPLPVEPGATRIRVVATKNHSRIRTQPDLHAEVVLTVNVGFAAVAQRTISGAEYDVAGLRSNQWFELVELGGKPLPTPRFSAAVLWRRS